MPDPRLATPPAADTMPEPTNGGHRFVQPNRPGLPVQPAPANPVRTPIPVPAVARGPAYSGAPVPEVESFDEETYVCKPGDTLAKICGEKYASEKYERALLMFNRAHPMAADGIRSEPAVLRPGQPVYLPPLQILEKRYAALIPNLASAAPPTPAALPVPAAPAPAAPPSTSWSAPQSDRLYKVQEKPETLWEIAARTLGQGERWSDIFRLNPGLQANGALPVGTVLRLPAQ